MVEDILKEFRVNEHHIVLSLNVAISSQELDNEPFILVLWIEDSFLDKVQCRRVIVLNQAKLLVNVLRHMMLTLLCSLVRCLLVNSE